MISSTKLRLDTGSTKEAYIPTADTFECGDCRHTFRGGRLYKMPMYCHKFHVCVKCLDRRIEKYRSRLLNHIKNGGTALLVNSMNMTDAEATVRQMTLPDYIRMPQGDGTMTLIVDTVQSDKLSNHQSIVIDNINDAANLDWATLVLTPENTGPDGRQLRLTGGLGKVLVPETETAYQVVEGEKLHVYTADATNDEIVSAAVEAICEIDTVPTTGQEYFDADNARTEVYASTLESYGVAVRRVRQTESAKITATDLRNWMSSIYLAEHGVSGDDWYLKPTRDALERRRQRLSQAN